MQPHQLANVRIRSDQPLHALTLFYDAGLHFIVPLTAVQHPGQ
jgi:hypothetical protein